MLPRARILSVGDELVTGSTLDTNTAHIAKLLVTHGFDVVGHATLPDGREIVADAIRDAVADARLLVITGGIGPTEDDLTREALADVAGCGLVRDEAWIQHLRELFAKIGRELKPGNLKQADHPATGALLHNPVGTAAGLRQDIDDCTVFVVPGVPKEMRRMVDDHVLPWAKEHGGGGAFALRTLHTIGRGESDVAALLGELHERGRNPEVGTTAAHGIVSLRLYCRADSQADAERMLDETEAQCRATLGNFIFGNGDETLASVIVKTLSDRGETVATAESCTGGLVAKMITDVAGSSGVFQHGWVTYSNGAKHDQLGVEIGAEGAVSESTVVQMAEGARRVAGSTYALSLSGVAGPGGGSDEKPVGTVCIALATPTNTTAEKFVFPGDRDWVRTRAALAALNMLRRSMI
ncbi:MAG: competence/damage-inducible protein A [Planctomycetota bacterium]